MLQEDNNKGLVQRESHSLTTTFFFWWPCTITTKIGLQDAFNAGDVSAAAVGRKVILPLSYVGGPRFMQQLYQDAIAIAYEKNSMPASSPSPVIRNDLIFPPSFSRANQLLTGGI